MRRGERNVLEKDNGSGLGKKLIKLRTEKQWTQRAFVDKINKYAVEYAKEKGLSEPPKVTHSSVTKWETGYLKAFPKSQIKNEDDPIGIFYHNCEPRMETLEFIAAFWRQELNDDKITAQWLREKDADNLKPGESEINKNHIYAYNGRPVWIEDENGDGKWAIVSLKDEMLVTGFSEGVKVEDFSGKIKTSNIYDYGVDEYGSAVTVDEFEDRPYWIVMRGAAKSLKIASDGWYIYDSKEHCFKADGNFPLSANQCGDLFFVFKDKPRGV